MAHRAVFFDLGGTLFRYQDVQPHFDRMLQRLAVRHSISASLDEIRRVYRESIARRTAQFQTRSFYLHRDLFTEAHRDLLAAFGTKATGGNGSDLYRGQIDVGLSAVTPREGVRDTLSALRAGGLHLGVVSNIDDDQFGPLWDHMGLGRYFDATTTSEQARSCKPHPQIYRVALSKAGAEPRQVVFVGDSPEQDIAGARALGMTTVLITQRPRTLAEPLRPDHVIERMPDLLEIVLG